MRHSPKQDAVRDIKDDIERENKLRNESRCFIAYRPYLNPVMRELVRQHVKQQKSLVK